ncbi:uncharacterized protein LACBIDRAFT_315853 [Laccaria bicolor S238N-H82]|uniref:Predicted protein n=1 Tax=Laccaria bicolor (strain S238N-H82 / ATCC MYA-4686) TaxID=486041 RepID=B0D3C6_LACBS|nr:uncharacterized protein LACBIDRAFT_315853 [Laccaria bicolor S238N-H82]EDR10893.1 predicted protein [Laccaria bicolor S238N-H82]|eukprot:XP_001878194.1 predicted protein [Laccaria bicolor S238N-H82]
MANEKKVVEEEEDTPKLFVWSIRSISYIIGWVLIFSLTCAELGLVSQQIHKFGRETSHYASLMWKNDLGLLLAAVIVSLLVTIFHYQLGLGAIIFFSLVLSVFFATGAGIIRGATPFRGTSCGNAVDLYPVIWQPFVGECRRIVSIQAIAWTLWALYMFMLFGSLAYKFGLRVKPTPGGFYGPSAV